MSAQAEPQGASAAAETEPPRLEALVAQRTAELERARRAAEAASEAKSHFLATVNHEIRTAMHGVVGLAEVLSQSGMGPPQSDLVRTMHESSLALLALIDDVLDFSRIEAGRLELERTPVALQTLVQGACDALRPGAAVRGVTLQFVVDPALPAQVLLDGVRWRQILNNLVSNAIKFSAGLERSGLVRVTVGPGEGATLRLTVTDNGIGMSDQTRALIFQPFVQAGRSITRRYGGSGLGLSIVQRLVTAFGGTIAVDSTPGAGSTFMVSVPLEPVPGAAAGGPSTAASSATAAPDTIGRRGLRLSDVPPGTRILVAENNAINRKVLVRQLALLGLAAEAAADGLQALTLWRTGRFALLLTDLHMPGLDGYGLARLVRAEQATGPRRPIIALTGAVVRGEAERCRDAGMDDYLTKPLTMARLASALRRWLVSRAPASTGPAAPGTPAVFDPSVLATLIGADAAVNERIRRQFAQSVRSTGTELRAAIDGGRIETAKSLAHRLRGSSGSVGALALASLCRGIEQAAAAGDGAALSGVAGALDETIAATLRRIEPPEDRAPAAVPAPPDGGGSVIVVDDDPVQLEVLRAQLAGIVDLPVHGVGSGAAALAAIGSGSSAQSLLVVDLDMPGMDGIELMRRLAAIDYRGALALMSIADERLLESGARLAAEHRLQVVGHLHKPIPVSALRALVERWRGHVPRPPRPAPGHYYAAEIGRAIAAHQFVLHFQPKVSLADGSLAGVEALLRWQHPRDGLVAPDAFIGAAEVGGHIDALTDEVIALALDQVRRWRERGLQVPVAVNVSMDNLVRLDFPERVLAMLGSRGLGTGDLVLEVTESRLMRDPCAALDILTRLRLHGVALAIDDFGTGHSSLAQLRDLPFDELKIDRGFVHGCGRIATRRAIVVASIEMAHQLGMRVVAEGVEDGSDWEAVRATGCDLAQGYGVARPMAAELLPGWIEGLTGRRDGLAGP